MAKLPPPLNSLIIERMNEAPIGTVWTPLDFLDLGQRDAVDKTLQRMVISSNLRRIDRGLYDRPRMNKLTRKPAAVDYRSIINAVARRNQVRILIDGITAANDLGLTNAVPGQIIVHTDGRIRPIQLDNLIIKFKLTAPSKLYWAGHPAMHIVQALYWLRENLKNDGLMTKEIKTKLIRFLQDPNHGSKICEDLQAGLNTLPLWMRKWIQELLVEV